VCQRLRGRVGLLEDLVDVGEMHFEGMFVLILGDCHCCECAGRFEFLDHYILVM
jgi:hypothetical protein